MDFDRDDSKFVTLRYNRDRFLAKGPGKWYEESPVRSSERRSRNRTPTPGLVLDAGETEGVKGGDAFNVSAKVLSFPPGTSAHHHALQSLAEYTTRPQDQEGDWLQDIHTVCDRLHLLKELHREVALMKRKLVGKADISIFQSSPAPMMLEDDATLTAEPEPEPFMPPFQEQEEMSTDSSSHQSMPPTQEETDQ